MYASYRGCLQVKALLMRSVRIFADRNSAANVHGHIAELWRHNVALRKPASDRRPALSWPCRVGHGAENSIFVGVANYYERAACTLLSLSLGRASAKPEEEPRRGKRASSTTG